MPNQRVILGLQEAHDASVCVMVGGKVVAAAQEERFTGLKGDYGLPRNAIDACLRKAGLDRKDIDEVALASHAWNPVLTKIKRNANFSVDDWVKEQRDYWHPRLFEGKDVNYYDLYKNRPDFSYDDSYPMDALLGGYMDPREMKEMARIRKETVAGFLGIDGAKVRTITHEECHAYYAYFASPLRGEVLCLTAEGIGDYSNGTVSRFDEMGRRELAHTKENHLGHIYQYMTLMLGMKPAQHEYKVMGLAPYANDYEVAKSYKVFENILKVDGLNIVFDQKPRDLYFHFRDALEGHRFDGIAGAVQQWLEEILMRWVSVAVAQTGLSRVVMAGGVAQNIKAMKRLVELAGVDDLFICPAAGDTSLPIGACYYAMHEHIVATKLSLDLLEPLPDMYLGPAFSDGDRTRAIEETKAGERYRITQNMRPESIAAVLAAGKVVGRSAGGMEFGLRSLGNRSILADPRDPATLRKINSAIKFRDFWMPFTPTVLAERASDYLSNPKSVRSPFMTMAFDTQPLAKSDLIAALHPADLTARPQVLERSANPDYYDIIKAFERRTGVGGILNTSFNLHGDPIALGPREAIYTLDHSELDALLIGDCMLSRFDPDSVEEA
jgi:carbamoyltransferase